MPPNSPNSQTPAQMPQPTTPPSPSFTTPTTPQPVQPQQPPVQAGNDFKPPKQPGGKKKSLIILIIVIILAAGAAVWWLFFKNNKATAPTSTNQSTQQSSQATTPTNSPDNIAYAFKAKDADPFALYYRPAIGGDRVQAKTLAAGETIVGGDTTGSNVVVASSKAIYASTDSGKNYTAILTLASGEQVTSIKFATDGKTIVYGDLPALGSKNTVKTIDITGKNNRNLFLSTSAGVFIVAYSPSEHKILYQEGCYNCDGGPSSTSIRDLSTNNTTKILTNAITGTITGIEVSDDFSTMIYSKSSATQAAVDAGTIAPFKITTVKLANNKSVDVATIGTKGEKNVDGTLKTHIIHVGFVEGASNPYYSADNQLFTINSAGKATMTFEATNPILYVPFVSTANVITGSGKDTSDFALANYDTATKKTIKIFQGDNNTIIFGVTTK